MTRTMTPVSLLYSLLAGPLLWFAHFVLVWGMAEFGCRINFSNLELVTAANIRQFVVITTFIAVIAVAVGGVLAYRNWVETQKHRIAAVAVPAPSSLRSRGASIGAGQDAASTAEVHHHSGWEFEDRYRFLAIVAMLLSGLFLVSIIATAMPAFFLDVCDLAV
jgi:hypothetical protein